MSGRELILATDYDDLAFDAEFPFNYRLHKIMRQAEEAMAHRLTYRLISERWAHPRVVHCRRCVDGDHDQCLNIVFGNDRCQCPHEEKR